LSLGHGCVSLSVSTPVTFERHCGSSSSNIGAAGRFSGFGFNLEIAALDVILSVGSADELYLDVSHQTIKSDTSLVTASGSGCTGSPADAEGTASVVFVVGGVTEGSVISGSAGFGEFSKIGAEETGFGDDLVRRGVGGDGVPSFDFVSGGSDLEEILEGGLECCRHLCFSY
jgi:hypothetical protein